MQMDGTYDWQRLGFYRHCVGYDSWAVRGVPVVLIVSGCYHAPERAPRACLKPTGRAACTPDEGSTGLRRQVPARDLMGVPTRARAGSLPWATHGQPWQYLVCPLTTPG